MWVPFVYTSTVVLNLYLRYVSSSSRYRSMLNHLKTPLGAFSCLLISCSRYFTPYLEANSVFDFILVTSYSPFHLRDQHNLRFESLHLFPAIYRLIFFKRIYIPIFVIMPTLSVLICIL